MAQGGGDLAVNPDLFRDPAAASPTRLTNPADVWKQIAAAQPGATPKPTTDINAPIDMGKFINKNMQLEGEGKDPRSNAVSGFMPQTWLGQIRQQFPFAKGMSDDTLLKMRDDPNLRQLMWGSLAQDNTKSLLAAGLPATATNLRLANWFGAAGAAKFLHASDDTPISQIFGTDVLSANPNLVGKTVGQVKESVASSMGEVAAPSMTDLKGQAQRVRDQNSAMADKLDASAQAAMKMISGQDKNIDEVMRRIRTAQDKADEAQSAALKAIGKAPAQPDIDGFKHVNGLAVLVGLLGGLFTKSPMRSSLNAAASALEAYNDHDREAYQIAYKNWQTQTDLLFKIADMTQSRVRDILYDEQMGLNERKALLDATLRAAGLSQLADQARVSGESTIYDWMEKMYTAKISHDEKMAQIESNQAFRMATLTMPKNQAQLVNQQLEEMDAEVFAATGQHIPPEERLKLLNKYSRGQPGGGLSDDAAELIAEQWIAGRTNVMVGLGRRTDDVEKVQNFVATKTAEEADKLGLPKEMRGRFLAIRAAEFEGLKAGERTAGQKAAQVDMASNEAYLMIPIAENASNKVDRTQYPSINALIEAVDAGTGDLNVVQFYTAINALVNAYSRAVTPVGATTDDMRKHAREVLDKNYSKEQFHVALATLKMEMEAARASPGMTIQQFRERFMAPGEPLGPAAAPAAAPSATPAALPPGIPAGSTLLPQTHNGHPVYKSPDGKHYEVQ